MRVLFTIYHPRFTRRKRGALNLRSSIPRTQVSRKDPSLPVGPLLFLLGRRWRWRLDIDVNLRRAATKQSSSKNKRQSQKQNYKNHENGDNTRVLSPLVGARVFTRRD